MANEIFQKVDLIDKMSQKNDSSPQELEFVKSTGSPYNDPRRHSSKATKNAVTGAKGNQNNNSAGTSSNHVKNKLSSALKTQKQQSAKPAQCKL